MAEYGEALQKYEKNEVLLFRCKWVVGVGAVISAIEFYYDFHIVGFGVVGNIAPLLPFYVALIAGGIHYVFKGGHERPYPPQPPEPDPLASVKGQQVFGDAFFAAAGEARSALGARAAAGASSMKFKD